jgi:hypothetical protein
MTFAPNIHFCGRQREEGEDRENKAKTERRRASQRDERGRQRVEGEKQREEGEDREKKGKTEKRRGRQRKEGEDKEMRGEDKE